MKFNVYLKSFIFLFGWGVFSQQVAAELPDFTTLIEEKSGAVVKINTKTKAKPPSYRLPRGQQLPDIFRHLLEPPNAPERSLSSIGSGFFISSDGYLITNNHVVEKADEIVIRMTDRREFDAEIIGTDPRSDLALLKVDAKDLPYLTLANSEDLKVGEWVVAIGSPFGLDFSASAGIVSAIGRSIPNGNGTGNYVPFVQTDVAINPGNSGGPLFNLDGEVVGVNSQIYTNSGGSIGLSFAIPANLTRNVVNQLKSKGHVDRGWLGVVIQEVDRNLADSFGLDKTQGALISQTEPGGPAEKAGLLAGDIILNFNGIEIESSSDLPHAVGIASPGDKVKVEVMRKGKRQTIDVKVGTLDKGQKLSSRGFDSSNRMGVEVDDLDKQAKRFHQLNGGVVVESVEPDSPAAKAGVAVGDVIAQIGFEDIKSASHFQKLIKNLPGDKVLPIRFFREGQPVFRTIVLPK